MAKKYRLEIPEEILDLVTSDFKEAQGKVGPTWVYQNKLIKLGWLTEVKELLTFDEWYNAEENEDITCQLASRSTSEEVWNAALENQKLEKVVDDKKDDLAFKKFNTAGKVLLQPGEKILNSTVRRIWNNALEYARGLYPEYWEDMRDESND